MRLQDFQLGTEDQLTRGQDAVEQRLDAETVARQEQAAGVAVVQGKGEHAAEAVDAALAPLLPGIKNDLGVAVGAEVVAQGRQLAGQLAEVVDLAVVDHAQIAVGAEHGLLAAGQVDDRQAPVGQAHPGGEVQATLVGAAVELRLVHGLEQGAIGLALLCQVEDAGDTAHA